MYEELREAEDQAKASSIVLDDLLHKLYERACKLRLEIQKENDHLKFIQKLSTRKFCF